MKIIRERVQKDFQTGQKGLIAYIRNKISLRDFDAKCRILAVFFSWPYSCSW